MVKNLIPTQYGRIWLIPVLMGLALVGSGRAESPGSGRALRIAVVDMDEVTRRSESVQQLVRQAETRIQEKKDRIDIKMDDLQRQRTELEQRRSVLSKEEIEQQQAALRTLREQIHDLQYDVNKQLESIRLDLMDPEVERIMETIGEVAEREGFDLVLRHEAALYFNEKADLTPLVVEALDQQTNDTHPPESPAE